MLFINYLLVNTKLFIKFISFFYTADIAAVGTPSKNFQMTKPAARLAAMFSTTKTTTMESFTMFAPQGKPQQKLDMLITLSMVLNCTPFEWVRGEGTEVLIKGMLPQGILKDPTTYSKRKLPLVYHNIKTRVDKYLTKYLPHLETVNFTTDFWKARNTKQFINLSIHFMTTSFKLAHFTLRFEIWTGRETAIEIGQRFTEIFNEIPGLENKTGKKFVLVTDGDRKLGAGIKRVPIPIVHILCADHQMELCLKNGFDHDNRTPKVVKELFDSARTIAGRIHQSAITVTILEKEAKRQRGK